MSQPDNELANGPADRVDEVAADEPEEPAKKLTGKAIFEQMGGVSGLIYSSLPVLVYVIVTSVAKSSPWLSSYGMMAAVYAALGTATLILIWRLARRESLQPAVSGFIGVGISALIAYLVGASKGYFLLGIWSSLLYATAFAVSVLIRRPIVGYVWAWVSGWDRGWRDNRRAVAAFDIATCTWVLVFGARFVVQKILYDDDREGLLGIARLAMGWPLTAVAALVTYLAIRAAQRAVREASPA